MFLLGRAITEKNSISAMLRIPSILTTLDVTLSWAPAGQAT